MREELTCCLCLDVAARPATLPCGHSACRGCLTELFNIGRDDAERRCPACRELLPASMPPLQLNATLKSLAELLLPGGSNTALDASSAHDASIRSACNPCLTFVVIHYTSFLPAPFTLPCAEECKERGVVPSPLPALSRPPLRQRVLLHSAAGRRSVSMHTARELTAAGMRAAHAGLRAMLDVLEDRWGSGSWGSLLHCCCRPVVLT